MPEDWDRHLDRWTSASLIDPETASRIRDFEAGHNSDTGLRWPVLIAVAFGAVLLGAGVLLFVSAHWDQLPPGGRMALVILLVAIFHVAGVVMTDRFPNMSVALHAVGTMALGAGIALTGQIFHLQTHWPAGIALWAFGALFGWFLLRQWPQAALAAILIPYWLAGEWWLAMDHLAAFDYAPAIVGIFLTALTYASARHDQNDSSLRRALAWIGGIGLLPAASVLWFDALRSRAPWDYQLAGWFVAILFPLAAALVLRGSGAWVNAAFAAWAIAVCLINQSQPGERLLDYPWFAIGSIGLIAWGMREQRVERINLGIAGFALTVLGFYFSSVMDKLGRSASLIGLGILFLAGGYVLEGVRRRLIQRIRPEPA